MSSKRNLKKNIARKEGREENNILNTNRYDNISTPRSGANEKRNEKDSTQTRYGNEERSTQRLVESKYSSAPRDLGESNWREGSGKKFENQTFSTHYPRDSISDTSTKRIQNHYSMRNQGFDKYEHSDHKKGAQDKTQDSFEEETTYENKYKNFINRNSHLLDGNFKFLSHWHINRFQDVVKNYKIQQENRNNHINQNTICYFKSKYTDPSEPILKEDFASQYEQAMERFWLREKFPEKPRNEQFAIKSPTVEVNGSAPITTSAFIHPHQPPPPLPFSANDQSSNIRHDTLHQISDYRNSTTEFSPISQSHSHHKLPISTPLLVNNHNNSDSLITNPSNLTKPPQTMHSNRGSSFAPHDSFHQKSKNANFNKL